MLLIQFSTMVIDRALYLRKTVLGKLAFQVVLVLAIHVWMFFILPAVTERWVLTGQAQPAEACFVVSGRAAFGSRGLGALGTGLGQSPNLSFLSHLGCSARMQWPSCGTL